jgi:hypothetical protein
VTLVKQIASFTSLAGIISKASTALTTFGGIAAAAGVGWTIGTWINDHVPVVSDLAQGFFELTDRVLNWSGTQRAATRDIQAEQEALEAYRSRLADVRQEIEATPSNKNITVEADAAKFEQQWEEIADWYFGIPDEKTITAEADIDQPSFDRVGGLIIQYVPDTDEVIIAADPDDESFREAERKIDELPSEKQLEIELKGRIDTEIARIKAQADTIQTAVEWRAKLDIANVEANARIIESAFESISASIESSGDLLGDLFGLLANNWGAARFEIERAIREEQRLRREALELQEKLVNAQIAYIEARTESIQRGEGIITIGADGLEPELEAFMWKILERIQVRANEDQAEFLLGINA